MKAIVTVFKRELEEREYVKVQLDVLCSDVKEVGQAIIYSPAGGKLVEFLSVLRFHKIAYGTHFDSKEEMQPIKL
jgi:hypothetical protein